MDAEDFSAEDFSDSDSEGGGGGGGNSIVGSFICCCIGLVLLPAALGFSGWNEQRAVCRDKAILAAESNYEDLNCDSSSGVKDGVLGLLQCPLNKATFKSFTEKDFTPLAAVGPIFGSAGAPAIKMRMTTKMYGCAEKCIQKACPQRRLRGEGSTDGTTDDFEDNEAITANTSDMSRRLKTNKRQCEPKCVQWAYTLAWYSTKPGYFNGTTQQAWQSRQATCGPYFQSVMTQNPVPSGFTLGGTEAVEATNVRVTSGAGGNASGAWELNNFQMNNVLYEGSPTLVSDNQPITASVQPPPFLNAQNTMVQNNALMSCQTLVLGCLEFTFEQSAPARITLLSAVGPAVSVSPAVRRFNEEGWPPPDSWMCTGKSYPINRVCPLGSTFTSNNGFTSCAEDISKEELFVTMANENSTTTWLYRAVGFVCVLLAVCSVFQPIVTIVETATDFLDSITGCIPGVGCIVDQMTDLFVGLVSCVVCGISFMCAISCFSFVVAIMWVVMRPWLGIPLFILTCCCCGLSVYTAKQCKSGSARKKPLSSSGSRDNVGDDDARGFIDAMHAEYVEAQDGVVGGFFDDHPGTEGKFGKYESQVRDADNREEMINQIARSLGV
jgi:hypothetical protein